MLGVTMLGTTLPTPLYVIYQGRWHFSAAMVTVTFAAYAATVLITLLLAGRSSDQAGRRPVMAVALAASALSTVLFILAPGIGVLIAARVVSGLSAGLMTGTATAALTELIPASAARRASLAATATNMGGLGLGPLVAGLSGTAIPAASASSSSTSAAPGTGPRLEGAALLGLDDHHAGKADRQERAATGSSFNSGLKEA